MRLRARTVCRREEKKELDVWLKRFPRRELGYCHRWSAWRAFRVVLHLQLGIKIDSEHPLFFFFISFICLSLAPTLCTSSSSHSPILSLSAFNIRVIVAFIFRITPLTFLKDFFLFRARIRKKHIVCLQLINNCFFFLSLYPSLPYLSFPLSL